MAAMTPRLVTLMITGALAVGWLSGSSTQSPAPAQSPRGSEGVRAVGSSTPIVQQAERLRQHMVQPPQPARGRNPFVYGSRPSVRSTS